jgi:DNA-binding transcriptional regulator YdaS (Cro superfamily)
MDADITRQAVDRAGGVVALAGQLGVTKGAVSQWERVPARHVLEVERLSGVSRHHLRPDVFGPEPQTA